MKTLLIFFVLAITTISSVAQTVKGRVIEQGSGKPLAGVNITLVNGSTSNTQSGAKGNFSFLLPAGKYSLKATYLGYKPVAINIHLPLADSLIIEMESEAQQLAEVSINTGYQTLPKERATGSFTKVDEKLFNEQVSTNVLARLEHTANGFSVDRKTNGGGIMIRGLSTINGPRSPLIVVDNFPYEGDLENINPNDVASITILKDAAAASIWGARAGNGVIVITTKRAAFNQSVNVAFNANTTFTEKPDLKYLKKIDATDFIRVERFLFDKGYYKNGELPTATAPLSPVVELLIAARDGQLSQTALTEQLELLGGIDNRNNYMQHFYETGIAQQYALRMNGGTDRMAWLLSLGHDSNKDNLAGTYQRSTVKLENSWQLLKGLQLSARAMLTHSASKTGKTEYTSLSSGTSQLPPYVTFADEQGNALPVMKDYRQKVIDALGTNALLNWDYYPLTDSEHSYIEQKLLDLLANITLNYKLNKNISATLNYQLQQQQTDSQRTDDADSYFTRNLINSFTQLGGGSPKRVVPLGSILDQTDGKLLAQNLRGQVNYHQEWAKHSVNLLLGGELLKSNTFNQIRTTYGYNPSILTAVNMDFVNTYPNVLTGRSSFIPNRNGFSESIRRNVSAFANLAYTYLGRYTLSLSARQDASNLFGVATNDKWNPLWSGGLAWDLNKENFFKSTWVDQLRLRATYGFSGNVNTTMAAVTTMSYGSTSPYTQTPYAVFANYSNPELRWERVGTVNLGLDFQLLNRKLGGSIAYYEKTASDLFGREYIDYTAGIGNSIIKNAAAMRAKGVDIALNFLQKIGPINWSSNGFMNYYRDKVTAYNLLSLQGSNFVNGNLSISGLVGKPVYGVFSYKWAGLDPQTGDPQGYLAGAISKNYASLTGAATQIGDLAYHGAAFPVYTAAWGNTFSWKGISLTARIAGKFGHYFRMPTQLDYTSLFSNRNGHADFSKRWQQPGDEQHTNVPSLVYPLVNGRDAFYTRSEATVLSGDFISLQYVNLGYQLQHKQLKRLGFKNAELFAVANQLGLLWAANKEGIHPDFNGMPNTKTFSLGFRANL